MYDNDIEVLELEKHAFKTVLLELANETEALKMFKRERKNSKPLLLRLR